MKASEVHRPFHIKSLSVWVVSILVAGSLAHPDQLLAQALDQTFEEYADVLEIEIPVTVAMRNGTPVRDLTVETFEVYDQGERQEITGFRVVDLELLEPGRTRTEIDRAVPAAARRHFLFLFDLSFSSPTSILRARRAAREFALGKLHPTDLAAVATHSVEDGARLLVTFTPDRVQVARAIDTLGAPRMLVLSRRDPLRFVIEDPGMAGFRASSDLTDLTGTGAINDMQESLIAHIKAIGKEMAKTEKSFHRGRIATWSRTMGVLARYLDNVKGRKHVIYFSEGFDGRLLLGRKPAPDDRDTQEDLRNIETGNIAFVDSDDMFGNTGLQSIVAIMLEEFRRADSVIEAVDISGLRADSAAVERARSVGQDALFYIANDTGGHFYEDANDFGVQLAHVLEQSSVTYILSIQPSGIEADGSYHRLKVKADLPRGARMSARDGYYAPRPYEQLHPLEKSLLASDAIAAAAARNDIDINVLAAAFPANESQAYVPVIIEVEGAALLASHEEERLPVEIYTYASDQRGEMKDFLTQMVTLDLSGRRDVFGSSGLKYYGHLDLPTGDYLLRVLVRNAATGRTGVETIAVTVPAYGQAEPVLLPPFFIETGSNWFLVREASGQEYQPTIAYPFTVNGEPYIPAASPILRAREEARICLVAYNLGEGEIVIDGAIVAEDGEVTDGALVLVGERTITGIEGLDKFVATFRPGGLEAGNYTLQVALRNLSSGAIERTSMPFALGVSD